nr:hypothetical protein [Microvirga pakistanensis]
MAAGLAGANFLSPAIAYVASRELAYREIGAVYDVDRLHMNLLSSQPLVFNLFAPLKRDLALATKVVAEILPGLMAEVTDILFEHAPARGHLAFTGDHTAFDLLIRGRTPSGKRAFIAVEVKYSESCQEPVPSMHSRYAELSASSGLFIQPEAASLRANPIQQLFRQHCLAQVMLQHDLADCGIYLFIAPTLNHLAQGAAATYAQHLAEPQSGQALFVNVALEHLIEAIAEVGEHNHARALYRRYCDWWLIDGELQLDAAPSTPEALAVEADPAASLEQAS